MSAAAARTPSTPYARRLGRERGIPLQQIRGSGPNGRIVAADIATYVAPVAPAGDAPAAVSQPVALAAFAATIDLRATRGLLADFANAGHAFTLEDMVLRALAGALSGRTEDAIAVETGARQVTILGAARMSLGAVHSARATAVSADDAPSAPADVSLRVRDAAVHPVLMPLLPGRSLRLVVSAGTETAEALMVFDTARFDEDHAAAVLGQFRENLEKPLRMLA